MKELVDIVNAYERAGTSGQRCAVATVVGATGSTYRRPGARMLFAESGRLAGLINSACLESDLSERAKRTILTGKPELISYDTTSPDDIVFGLGLGCNGTVEIFMEPGPSSTLAGKIEILKKSATGDAPISLATVIAADAASGLNPGDFAAWNPDGTVTGSLASSSFSSSIITDIKNLQERLFTQKTYPFGKGSVRMFLETLLPPLPLVIFGAGPDARPLVDAAKLLGWRVTVVDHRPAYATTVNIPDADAVLLAEPEQFPGRMTLGERHVAVIMTHNFDKDRKLLRILLESPVRYVGLLGPGSKLQTLLQNLEQDGFKPNRVQMNKLHAPIGLDIGAETPEEIAFSIVSEIKAVLERRTGGFLKNRTGPIH